MQAAASANTSNQDLTFLSRIPLDLATNAQNQFSWYLDFGLFSPSVVTSSCANFNASFGELLDLFSSDAAAPPAAGGAGDVNLGASLIGGEGIGCLTASFIELERISEMNSRMYCKGLRTEYENVCLLPILMLVLAWIKA